MTLDEAIQILENDTPMPLPLDIGKIDEADDLSIEALKEMKAERIIYGFKRHIKMPGETEE